MGVSENGATPKSSILIGVSIINYKPSILGYQYFWKHPYTNWGIGVSSSISSEKKWLGNFQVTEACTGPLDPNLPRGSFDGLNSARPGSRSNVPFTTWEGCCNFQASFFWDLHHLFMDQGSYERIKHCATEQMQEKCLPNTGKRNTSAAKWAVACAKFHENPRCFRDMHTYCVLALETRIGMMVNQILGPAFITTAYLLPYSHIHGCPFFGHQDMKLMNDVSTKQCTAKIENQSPVILGGLPNSLLHAYLKIWKRNASPLAKKNTKKNCQKCQKLTFLTILQWRGFSVSVGISHPRKWEKKIMFWWWASLETKGVNHPRLNLKSIRIRIQKSIKTHRTWAKKKLCNHSLLLFDFDDFDGVELLLDKSEHDLYNKKPGCKYSCFSSPTSGNFSSWEFLLSRDQRFNLWGVTEPASFFSYYATCRCSWPGSGVKKDPGRVE